MKMHDCCSHCGFRFKVEPNFFFGAMYVSYGVAVLVGVITFLIGFCAFNASLKTAFIAIFGVLILLMPIVTRISRNIYINLFVNYDPVRD
jgi:drug/metabolite transporter (DMT)-like permease